MKTFLKLSSDNRVIGWSTQNMRKPILPEGHVDVTDLELPEDLFSNPDQYVFEDGNVRLETPEEKKAKDFPDADYLDRLRRDRDELLSKSDWTQVPDAPVDQQAWATYRQELRDLPDNTTDPRNPVWPTKPN